MDPNIPGFDSLPSPLQEEILVMGVYENLFPLSEQSQKVKDLAAKPEFWQRFARNEGIVIKDLSQAQVEVMSVLKERIRYLYEIIHKKGYMSLAAHEALDYLVKNELEVLLKNFYISSRDTLNFEDIQKSYKLMMTFISRNKELLTFMAKTALNDDRWDILQILFNEGIYTNDVWSFVSSANNIIKSMMNFPEHEAINNKNANIAKEILSKIMERSSPKDKQECARTFFTLFYPLHTFTDEKKDKIALNFNKDLYRILYNAGVPVIYDMFETAINSQNPKTVAFLLENGAVVTQDLIELAKLLGNAEIIALLEGKS